jgi:hypothetical protein
MKHLKRRTKILLDDSQILKKSTIHKTKQAQKKIEDTKCRRFDPGGSLDRRVNCRCVSQPRWVGARRNTKGGNSKGKPWSSCCPAPRADALAVGGYKRSRGRERESLMRRLVLPRGQPSRTRAMDLPLRAAVVMEHTGCHHYLFTGASRMRRRSCST